MRWFCALKNFDVSVHLYGAYDKCVIIHCSHDSVGSGSVRPTSMRKVRSHRKSQQSIMPKTNSTLWRLRCESGSLCLHIYFVVRMSEKKNCVNSSSKGQIQFSLCIHIYLQHLALTEHSFHMFHRYIHSSNCYSPTKNSLSYYMNANKKMSNSFGGFVLSSFC